MRSNALLILVTGLGAAVAWWPLAVRPSLDLPFWVSFTCVALCTVLATTLAPRSWPWLLLASSLGTVGGICLSVIIWPPSDPIGAGYLPYILAAIMLTVMFVAFSAGVIMRERSISSEISRRVIWAAILACVVFGPVTLALTPPLVRHRIARNDRMAAERFASLKKAVESTSEAEGLSQICYGTVLKGHYAGASFSDTDWGIITGNPVKKDGYNFVIHCREQHGYTVAAYPARAQGDGTRQFCADESRRAGCRMELDRLRYKCRPCP